MPKLTERGEREIVAGLIRALDPEGRMLLGDDCAMLDMGAEYLLATTDVMTASTHIPSGTEPEDVGWYAAAINLSDIAAMGGEPQGMLFALGLPRDTDVKWLERLVSGMRDCCEAYSAPIMGGDTKENPNITISGTALGRVPKDRVLRRSGARPGDLLAMTGCLGRGILWERDPGHPEILLRVSPRIREGIALAGSGICTSCIDVSDGLSTCLHLMSAAGGVGFVMEPEKVPLMPGLEKDALDKAIHWGGDFELLFTVKRDKAAELARLVPGATVIGEVTSDREISLRKNRRTVPLPDRGYEHFMRRD
jgi:thiamine-monophosphate kinase